jgi:hypothetical protein
VEVGTLDKPAGATLAARLEFYFGELNVISSDGRNRPVNDRMEITSGDRVLTEASTRQKSPLELSPELTLTIIRNWYLTKSALWKTKKR